MASPNLPAARRYDGRGTLVRLLALLLVTAATRLLTLAGILVAAATTTAVLLTLAGILVATALTLAGILIATALTLAGILIATAGLLTLAAAARLSGQLLGVYPELAQ
ncbi:MAG: hypothetical protein JO286_13955 [Solirubrobacterales bacterium]|nr:hypothetical protein [Solirubrobacterales bacterium]